MILAGLALTVATAIVIDKNSPDTENDNVWSVRPDEADEEPFDDESMGIPAPPAPPKSLSAVSVDKNGGLVTIKLDGEGDPEALKAKIEAKKAEIEAKLVKLNGMDGKIREALSKMSIKTEDGQVVIINSAGGDTGSQAYIQIAEAYEALANQISPEKAAAIAAEAAKAAKASHAYSYSFSTSNGFSHSDNMFDPTFTAVANGLEVVSLSTAAGNVSVTSSEEENVQIMVKPSRGGITKEEMEREYSIRFNNRGSEVTVEIERKDDRKNVNFGVDIVARIPSGKKVTGTSNGGNLTVTDYEGKVFLSTKGGNVTLTDCSGDMEATTKGGNITLTDLTGRLNIQTSGGNISMTDVEADLVAHTNGGNLQLTDVSGSIKASTNGGSITANLGELTSVCDLKTNAGNIDIQLEEESGVNLDLRGMEVSVPKSGFSGNIQKTRAEGTLNGGGKALRAQTNAGRVTIRN